jgi:CBS domain-containing protein
MNAEDVMTTRVISVSPDDSILHAARLMLQQRISGLPVVDADRGIVGIVSEGDFLRRVELGTQRRRPRWIEYLLTAGKRADEYVHAHGRKVGEVMTHDPKTIEESTPLDEVVEIMERCRVKRLPVVRNGKLVGIITRANLLRALASLAQEVEPPARDDATIRNWLMADLEKRDWAPLALISIVVRNGIVELWGTITDERQRQAITVAAENIPGVKGVRDHLAWMDSMSGAVLLAPGDELQPEKTS